MSSMQTLGEEPAYLNGSRTVLKPSSCWRYTTVEKSETWVWGVLKPAYKPSTDPAGGTYFTRQVIP